MARIEKSIRIDAPVKKVFDFVVSEWSKQMSFFEGIIDWRPLTNKPLGNGFRIAYKVKILGLVNEIEMAVSDFKKNRGWIAESTKGPKTRGEWGFSPAVKGTQFSYTLDYRMPMSIIGKILDILFVKRYWVQLIERSLQNLKQMLEKD